MSVDLLERRAEVVEKLEDFETVIDPILTILAKPEVSKHLESSKWVPIASIYVAGKNETFFL